MSVRRSPFGGFSFPPAAPYAYLVPRSMSYPVERDISPAKVAAAGLIVATPRQPSSFTGRNPLAALCKEIATEKYEVRVSVLQNAQPLTSLSSEGYAEFHPVAVRDPWVIFDMGREVDGYLQFSVVCEKLVETTIGWSEMMKHGDIAADDSGGNYMANTTLCQQSRTGPCGDGMGCISWNCHSII